MRPSLAACCVLAASALSAGDVAWRLGIESEPVAYRWSVERAGIRMRGEDEFARHAGMIGGAHLATPLDGRWMFIVGAEAAAGEARDGALGGLRWGELRLVQGLACRIAPRLEATLLLRGGGGLDRFEASGSSAASAIDADGRHAAIAAELGAVLALSTRLALTAGAGWRASQAHLRDDAAGTGVCIDQSGPTVSLGLSWQP